MLVSFKGDEEKLIDSVISVLDAGREKFTFQEMNIISELQHKGIIINLERREVIRNGKKVGMTYTEFEILQLLAKNPGRVLSKEQIYDVVWKESYSGDYNIVMSHISHIREKIEDDLRYQQAEIIYSISHKKLLELASDAGAIYRIDGTVLIRRDIFDDYLERFHEPATGKDKEKKTDER